MPIKIRDVKRELRRAGFTEDTARGKGSHVMFFHPRVQKPATVPGRDGDDAPLYLVKHIRKKIEESKS